MANALGLGVDSVVDWYSLNAEQFPYFSVWRNNTDIFFQYNEDDVEKGIELLRNNLLAAEQNNYKDILIIKLHPYKEKNFISRKTDVAFSYTFRLFSLEQLQTTPYNPLFNSNNFNKIEERLSGIEERLNEEPEEEEQQSSISGIINNLLNNPEMQKALVGFIGTLASKFLMPKQNSLAIGNIPNDANEDVKIKAAIEVLKQYDSNLGNDLLMLGEMAKNNNSQFNFLLCH